VPEGEPKLDAIRKRLQANEGFTLIELLVVIIIIGILLAIAILQASYDAGIKNIRVKSANSTTYCLDSTVGNSVYKKAGPGAPITSGACP
jgi:prepilin-type N-terminal cleavage/methylation domain-containing protein